MITEILIQIKISTHQIGKIEGNGSIKNHVQAIFEDLENYNWMSNKKCTIYTYTKSKLSQNFIFFSFIMFFKSYTMSTFYKQKVFSNRPKMRLHLKGMTKGNL